MSGYSENMEGEDFGELSRAAVLSHFKHAVGMSALLALVGKARQALAGVLQSFVVTIDRLVRIMVAGRLVPFLLLLALTGVNAAYSGTPERQFLRRQADAYTASAVKPEDWKRTAMIYRQLADTGARNGTIFYNEGTAWLNAGEYDKAVQALLRAEIYLGKQPDLAHNLKIALTRQSGRDNVEWPWYRFPFAWHFALSAAMRLQIAALSFLGVWIGLTLIIMNRRRAGRAILVPMLFVWMVFTSSYLTSLLYLNS